MTMEFFYPADGEILACFTDAKLDTFKAWMNELDAEHTRLGHPYGQGPLAKLTGLHCWLEFFEDDWAPAAALEEDLSNS